MFLTKEARKEFEQYKLELKKKEQERRRLINRNIDWAAFQEFIARCNDNPGLQITVTFKDGTKVDLCAPKEQKKVNPLFTDAAYTE